MRPKLPSLLGIALSACLALLVVIGLWPAEADDADNRTWKDLKALAQQLGALSDRSYGTMILIHHDGSASITVERNGTTYRGKGRNPWEAAQDVAGKSEEVRKGVEQAMQPGS